MSEPLPLHLTLASLVWREQVLHATSIEKTTKLIWQLWPLPLAPLTPHAHIVCIYVGDRWQVAGSSNGYLGVKRPQQLYALC